MKHYRITGHRCDSPHPNMRVRRFTVDGSTSGCEHQRVEADLSDEAAQTVIHLMDRLGLKPSVKVTDLPENHHTQGDTHHAQ